MSDIMEQQRQHGEAQELAAKELMGGCIEAAVETADFSTTEVGNWHSWLREEVVKALREREAEIERLRLENSQWQSACAGYTEALAARDRDNAALRTALQNARIELKRMKEYYEPDPGSED